MTTLYVAGTADGNDADPGTYFSPLATGAQAMTMVAAGDTVLFKSARTFLETVTASQTGLIFGRYGDGVPPIFDGSDLLVNADFAVEDAPTNTYKIVFQAGRSTCNAVWENGIKLASVVDLATCKTTAGSSCYVHNANPALAIVYVHSAQADPNPGTNGCVYRAASRTTPLDGNSKDDLIYTDLQVQRAYSDLSAHNISGSHCQVLRGYYTNNSTHHVITGGHSNLIEDCYGIDCAGGAFIPYGVNAIGNTFRRCQSYGTTVWTGSAFQSHGAATGNIIEYCVMSQSVNQTVGSGAIGLSEAGTSGNIFRYNRITGNWQNAMRITSHGDSNEFYGNLILGTALRNPAIYLSATTQGILIYNNTHIGAGWGILIMVNGATCTMQNNLIYQDSDWYVYAYTGYVGNNNLYFKSTRLTAWQFDGAQKNFADWQTASGEAASLNVDPLLFSAAGGKYWLQVGSPCLAGGADLGAGYQARLAPMARLAADVTTADVATIGAYRRRIRTTNRGRSGRRAGLLA